ncbi:PREDICTED: mid1-interacting protein 1-B [Nicrophorus vespilloides]|uniref:Mid1-interacting protein 1-B n=1 Tax=Nicrophorus vespilloides TaxID=110193 RepID=A0ABM1MHJ5_NICVS|nr:PREDICTED: mid1-interacting protein 1-B [Nicrophorus vespilloides]XP_017774045.1 PREDICTED: mid1-interacting protein 1-B [Nicrophorus vespilloides]
MSSYTENITTSMENSRNCLKRIARNDDTEFSNQSILNAMEKFVKSVNTMDETILVPCRLMDLKVGDEQDPTTGPKQKTNISSILNSADLFDMYNMLNTVKADLLWGQGQCPEEEEKVVKEVAPQTTLAAPKGHIRRPSTVSVSSTNSSTSSISDSDSEIGNENDSGIEEPPQVSDRTQVVAQNFRRHLHGLTKSLRQLTDAAQYLTTRYQHDIGSSI